MIVSAPPGYGKTTLLAGWAKVRRAAGQKTLWMTLDEGDNQEGSFWRKWMTAITRQDESSLPTTGEVAAAESAKEIRVTDVLGWAERVLTPGTVMILDEVQQVNSVETLAGLRHLLQYLPSGLHLVLGTRTDPPVPLSVYRLSGELREVRRVDLEFTLAETETFFKLGARVELPPAVVHQWHQRAEGWIAGLCLLKQAYTQQPVKAGQGEWDGVGLRYLREYFDERVMPLLDGDVKEFLFKVAILKRLSSGLCTALTGRADSQEILERLAREHLFLFPVDDIGQWFRFHQMFAEFLSHKLNQHSPYLVPDLHRRAAAWYEQSGWPAEAFIHALAGRDYETALRLLADVQEDCRRTGRVREFLDWVERLPVLNQEARFRQAEGQSERAVDCPDDSVEMAGEEGAQRLFLDDGSPVEALWRELHARQADVNAGDGRDLLYASGAQGQGPGGNSERVLSPREMEVLQLIARGKTYREIAGELVIALSTVQTHVKNIYAKLEAHSGLEAIARARKLGLIG